MFEEEEGCSGLQTKKHKCQTARILGEDVRRLLGTAVFGFFMCTQFSSGIFIWRRINWHSS